MQTTKKKPSLIFIIVGAVLSGYLGYLINGAWTKGIAFNEFMDRFNDICAIPFANYYNSNTVKAVAIALGIYAMAIVMYYTSATNGNTGTKPARNPEREKPKWEDTITNRMLHWSYTPEQKEEVKKALAAGVPKATILTYFYPEVTVERMSSYRKKQ